MDNWVPFGEGEYLVEQALLVAATDTAVAVDNVVIEVYEDPQGHRHLKGRGRIRNILMIELLEDSDDLDLLLDFGGEFKFLLKEPMLQSGKVFSPDARSVLLFIPKTPWEQLPSTDFDNLMSRLRLLTDADIS
jgi:hypothetical protein